MESASAIDEAWIIPSYKDEESTFFNDKETERSDEQDVPPEPWNCTLKDTLWTMATTAICASSILVWSSHIDDRSRSDRVGVWTCTENVTRSNRYRRAVDTVGIEPDSTINAIRSLLCDDQVAQVVLCISFITYTVSAIYLVNRQHHFRHRSTLLTFAIMLSLILCKTTVSRERFLPVFLLQFIPWTILAAETISLFLGFLGERKTVKSRRCDILIADVA